MSDVDLCIRQKTVPVLEGLINRSSKIGFNALYMYFLTINTCL